MRRRVLGLLLGAGILFSIPGCAAPEIFQNKSIASLPENKRPSLGEGGYRLPAMSQRESSSQLMMFVAFSGGGKRSSAFSYGALRGLRDISVRNAAGEQHRLLDEVDGIGSVSGGTFTAAYYALHRDGIFDDYERDFLKQDIESYIWGIYLLPWHWGWMLHPAYGTNDAMQQVYDKLMFHGATFDDLKKLGRPLLWIGATDIGYGRVFTFNEDTFDLICSDLGSFPLARAVAASNGFPVLFSPVTLTNHAKDCGGWAPAWIKQSASGTEDTQNRRRILAKAAEDYLDSSRTQYIHLSDGGVVDNLALRGLLNQLISLEQDPRFERAQEVLAIRRLAVIVVDGEAAQNTSLARDRLVTGIGQIINSVTGSQIDNYNFETMSVMRGKLDDYVRHIKELRCNIARVIDGQPCDDVKSYLVHISLSEIKDPAVRARLQSIPTGLTISDDDVDALVAAGEAAIKTSPEIAEIVKALNMGASPSPAQIGRDPWNFSSPGT